MSTAPTKDSLGDRMKANYEDRGRHYLTRRTPVIVRVDGKAFHTFTRGLDRPFDHRLMTAMVEAAISVAGQMQGFKLAYVQSDEVSFLITDFDRLETGAWFDYNKAKIESITASAMTAYFNAAFSQLADQGGPSDPTPIFTAMFDARAFNIPREEVANYFLWRAQDWERNSLQMYCQAHFSPKQLHGKGKADQHELLHSIGRNWATDLTEQQRNGTFILNFPRHWFGEGDVVRGTDTLQTRTEVRPDYNQIAGILRDRLREAPEPTDEPDLVKRAMLEAVLKGPAKPRELPISRRMTATEAGDLWTIAYTDPGGALMYVVAARKEEPEVVTEEAVPVEAFNNNARWAVHAKNIAEYLRDHGAAELTDRSLMGVAAAPAGMMAALSRNRYDETPNPVDLLWEWMQFTPPTE